jgi:hypothetical protein
LCPDPTLRFDGFNCARTPQHTGYYYDQAALADANSDYFIPTVSMNDLWGKDVTADNGVRGWFEVNIILILFLTVAAKESIICAAFGV